MRARWIGLLAAALAPSRALGAPGEHVQLGELDVIPSVAAGVTYHSNVYLADGVTEDAIGAPALQLQPGIAFALDKPDVQLDAAVSYRLRKYVDLVQDDVRVDNLDGFNEVDSSLRLRAFRTSAVGLSVDDTFTSRNYPTGGAENEGNANSVTTSNDLLGGLIFRGGTAVEVETLAALRIDDYRIPGVGQYNNAVSRGPVLNGKWRVSPKTALVSHNAVTWAGWGDNLVRAVGPEFEGGDYGEYVGKPDSLAWYTIWGVEGKPTGKIWVQAQVGYGEAYQDEATVVAEAAGVDPSEIDGSGAGEGYAQDLTGFPKGLIVRTLVTWEPLSHQALSLGYNKDFRDTLFTNYVSFHYGFLRYKGGLAGRLGLGVELGLWRDAFHGEMSRVDLNLQATVELTYKVTSFVEIHLVGGWRQRSCGEVDCASQFYTTQYDDLRGELGVTVAY